MKEREVDNSSVTASSRGGVGSNVKRTQSTVTKVNTTRRLRWTSLLAKGEVEPNETEKAECQSNWEAKGTNRGGTLVIVGVVGDSRLGKGSVSEDGRTLRIDHRQRCRREVRALVVAKKQGNSCGAKGGAGRQIEEQHEPRKPNDVSS